MRIQWSKLSKQDIIDIGKDRFDNKFSYKNINTNNIKSVKSKISITCNKCGAIFISTIENHFNCKKSCPKCAIKRSAKNRSRKMLDLLKLINNKFINHNFESLKCYDVAPLTKEFIFFCDNHESTIVCKRTAAELLRGTGCYVCSSKTKMNLFIFKEKNKLTNSTLDISKIKEHHFNKGVLSKIPLLCNKHGKIFITVNEYLNSAGCKFCNSHKGALNRKITIKEIINRGNKKHNNKYSYKKLLQMQDKDIINNYQKIPVICLNHNSPIIFYPTITGHINNGSGCRVCAKNLPITVDNFKKRSVEKHNNKYDYSLIKNINGIAHKVKIICNNHEKDFVFKQRVGDHLNGYGCPKCSHRISTKEEQWLNSLNIQNLQRQVKLDCLKSNQTVDGYDPETNTVYEFYGDYWHGNPEKYDLNKIHPARKVTFGELYRRTIEKENIIKNAGCNLITMWESNYVN